MSGTNQVNETVNKSNRSSWSLSQVAPPEMELFLFSSARKGIMSSDFRHSSGVLMLMAAFLFFSGEYKSQLAGQFQLISSLFFCLFICYSKGVVLNIAWWRTGFQGIRQCSRNHSSL